MARRPEFAGRSSTALRLRWLRIGSDSPELIVPIEVTAAQQVFGAVSVQWPSLPVPSRDRSRGRPWDYFVSLSILSQRVPTSRQSKMLQCWGLLGHLWC